MSADAERSVKEAFGAICDFALAHGATLPVEAAGCWEHQVDKHWWIAVNRTNEKRECSKGGPALEPFHAYIEFNGWPAGVINPYGGVIAAGAAANEDTFIAALQAATARPAEQRER